jgi:steroid 5-alpha-reductase
MNVTILISGILFNLINSYINGKYLSTICSPDIDYNSATYWKSWNFGAGLVIFFCGMWINIQADNILMGLRDTATFKSQIPSSYKIPQGGMFTFVSCANYFGEILEWFGFSLLTWNIASFSFFWMTSCNLIPRAYSHHLWYKTNFKDSYPQNRRAVIPFVL